MGAALFLAEPPGVWRAFLPDRFGRESGRKDRDQRNPLPPVPGLGHAYGTYPPQSRHTTLGQLAAESVPGRPELRLEQSLHQPGRLPLLLAGINASPPAIG